MQTDSEQIICFETKQSSCESTLSVMNGVDHRFVQNYYKRDLSIYKPKMMVCLHN